VLSSRILEICSGYNDFLDNQEGGEALGAQAGPAAIADVVKSGGFSHFRTAIATPFNLVFEARP